jgi:transcriptional regulator with XRE-family HTH domain
VVGVEQWAEIRRLRFVKGLSQREIHRRTGLHRDTIRRAVANSGPPVYRRALGPITVFSPPLIIEIPQAARA